MILKHIFYRNNRRTNFIFSLLNAQFLSFMNECVGMVSTESNYYLTKYGCLHNFFEAQADIFPDKIALICAGQYLTYQELEQ